MPSFSRIAVTALAVAILGLAGARAAAPAPLSAPQTIAVQVHAPAAAAYNDAFTVRATASSGMAVVYSSAGSCSNSGAMFTMTSGGGTCQVRYAQPGGAGFAPAMQVVETVTAQKSDQTISFEPVGPQKFGGGDVAVSALATSSLPVTLTTTGKCTASGAIVHLTGAGTCAVTGSQAGDANYNPAPNAAISFAIAKGDQKISFAAIPRQTLATASFAADATASSDLAVSLAARGKCTVKGLTVRLTGSGTCTLTASQPGDADWNAAAPVSRTFAIVEPKPTCTVPDVRNEKVAAAKAALAHAHCRVGKLSYAYSHTSQKGRVVSQSVRPGRARPAGTKVSLVIGVGRRR